MALKNLRGSKATTAGDNQVSFPATPPSPATSSSGGLFLFPLLVAHLYFFLPTNREAYSVANSQILTGSDLPDLADTYNRLSRLAVTLTQPMHDTPVSAHVMSGGRSHSSFVGTSGRGAGRGRFQCSYCGKLGHLEDRCWEKHPNLCSVGPPGRRGGRTSTGKGSSSSTTTSSQATASMVESPTCSPSYSLNLSKEEYELVLAQRSTPASTNTAAIDSAFSSDHSYARAKLCNPAAKGFSLFFSAATLSMQVFPFITIRACQADGGKALDILSQPYNPQSIKVEGGT
ncbi:hypothetical protein EJ110_NYTH48449 [Nymphaea thermarum]|nr:hypothetical protein EJ110_NYTH48449 [Nymphaea thermarum]